MHDRQASPVKEALAFGARTGRETVPIARAQGLPGDARDIAEQKTRPCLYTDDFSGRNGQHVGVALVLQASAQFGAVAVDRIGHDPRIGNRACLSTLDHALRQFRFGGKGNMVRDMSGLSAWQISAPVFGQIQFAVDESMAQLSNVGEKDTHLAVFTRPLRRNIGARRQPNGAHVWESRFRQSENGENWGGMQAEGGCKVWQTKPRRSSRTPSSSQTARESKRWMP